MEISAKIIQKYSKYSTPQLKLKASKKFRAFIRRRDAGEQCISCDSWNTSDASHYFSAGNYPALEFDPDNCHTACRKCNYFLSGNLVEYHKKLLKKIGEERVLKLEEKAAFYKRNGWKHSRIFLIEKLLQYQ